MNISTGVVRMINLMIFVLVVVHIVSCLWFLQARFYEFSPDTWVSRLQLQDYSPRDQYLYSLYWSFQTLTTVGYGDIGVGNNTEKIFTIVWMFIGVSFYSFAIGNIQTIVAEKTQKQDGLYTRLSQFRSKASLDMPLYLRIRKFIVINYEQISSHLD